jgi:hypothetical protein
LGLEYEYIYGIFASKNWSGERFWRLLLGCGLAQAQITPVSTNPIFQDDFNAGSLDPTNWSIYGKSIR